MHKISHVFFDLVVCALNSMHSPEICQIYRWAQEVLSILADCCNDSFLNFFSDFIGEVGCHLVRKIHEGNWFITYRVGKIAWVCLPLLTTTHEMTLRHGNWFLWYKIVKSTVHTAEIVIFSFSSVGATFQNLPKSCQLTVIALKSVWPSQHCHKYSPSSPWTLKYWISSQ